MAEIDRMLETNAAWAGQAPGLGGPARPSRGAAVVACMDARMDVYRLLGLVPGEAHVIRNAGGVVTDDVLRSLAISQHVLGTREVVLVHHTRCGLAGADEAAFADQVEQATGQRPPWPMRAFADVEEDVRESMRLVRESPYLLAAEVRGTVYDVDTGRLRTVV
ncbi:carbonic anhydrase [Blastococcus sp. BMG 814]|uniref:carbonic anhydrase n=1 Tax=Blastococcus carthaginiensis TaxID=3050034 RepID=A0ABT9I8L0_9ACTN|nr:carbonic anhydrase [Blastococcus carthaginiensis]MDP5181509.1 carbonic anhydrase [Blastococcus carthaginiensis]